VNHFLRSDCCTNTYRAAVFAASLLQVIPTVPAHNRTVKVEHSELQHKHNCSSDNMYKLGDGEKFSGYVQEI
jgi:hypothetical protein